MNYNNKGKLVALLIASILPIIGIVLGFMMRFNGWLLNFSHAVTFIIIPLIAIILLAAVILLGKKVFIKIILTVLLLAVFVISFLIFLGFGFHEQIFCTRNDEISIAYAETVNLYESMPTLNEVGDYSNVEYYDYFSQGFVFFTCDGDTLIVQYDSQEEYEKQKALLDERYIFEEDEIGAHGYYVFPTVTVDGYCFRVLDTDGKYGREIDYPKSLVFIATNDAERKIAYTAFYDDDRDYIESLEDHLLNDCGWKYILKELE